MKSKATDVVRFKDILEINSDPHFGILFEDETILCLCCGGIIEKGDYKILEHISFGEVDEVLTKELSE